MVVNVCLVEINYLFVGPFNLYKIQVVDNLGILKFLVYENLISALSFLVVFLFWNRNKISIF